MKSLIVFLLILTPYLFAQSGRIATIEEKTGGIVISPIGQNVPGFSHSSEQTESLNLLPGWPQTMPVHGFFKPTRGVALADIDNDDTLEVVASSKNFINVYRYDGTLMWSRTLINVAQYAPSVADVDNDGWLEIAQTTRELTSGGRVYLMDHNGNDLPGWPVSFSNHNFACSATLADVDGDSLMEVIFGERAYPVGYVHCLKLDGTELNVNWPVAIDHVPAVTAAVGDIDQDSQQEIVYCSYNSIYVFKPDGSLLPGFPVTVAPNAHFSYQSPLLVDLNEDQTLEIIFGTHGTVPAIHVLDYTGTEMPGWPYIIPNGSWTYCPPTAVAPPGSNDFKIYEGVAGSITLLPVVYGFAEDGGLLPYFPFYEIGGAEGHIAVADIDNDGAHEVIFDSNVIDGDGLGYIHAYKQDGTGEAPGFPLRPTGFTYLNGANLGDLNKDGVLDLVSFSYDDNFAYITAWSLGVPFQPEHVLFRTYHADNSRDGLYRQPQGQPTGIAHTPQVVSGFRVSPVYPNPFNGQAQFTVTLAQPGKVLVRVFNLLGKDQKVLARGNLSAGQHTFSLDSDEFASGVYFLQVVNITNGSRISQKFVIMK